MSAETEVHYPATHITRLGAMSLIALVWAVIYASSWSVATAVMVCVPASILALIFAALIDDATQTDKAEEAKKEAARRKKPLPVWYFPLSTLCLWICITFHVYMADTAPMHPAWVGDMESAVYTRFFEGRGQVGLGIQAALMELTAQMPDADFWRMRANVALAFSVAGFGLSILLIRKFSAAQWAATMFYAMTFSLAFYQVGKATVPVDAPQMTCQDYVVGASRQASLSTDDMGFLSRMRCPLPSGFRMDRLERIN